jgi:hypothetical protein
MGDAICGLRTIQTAYVARHIDRCNTLDTRLKPASGDASALDTMVQRSMATIGAGAKSWILVVDDAHGQPDNVGIDVLVVIADGLP